MALVQPSAHFLPELGVMHLVCHISARGYCSVEWYQLWVPVSSELMPGQM